MGDDMFAEDVFDGPEVFLEIRLGDETIRSGGYSPMDADKKFKSIIKKLDSIIELD